jgi:ubiquinone/menaquinone biosynthesis C-methylase UbiE
MITTTITRSDARRIYDSLGVGLDRAQRFERRAKQLGLGLLAVGPGLHVLHVGVGTGAEHAVLHAAAPGGLVVGYDLSRGMLRLTAQRADGPLCEGDAARLPFRDQSFDRLFSAYMLDLLPHDDLPGVLAEFRRVLRPGGRLALVSLTEGIDVASRLFVGGWKLAFRLDPQRMGGCRPLLLHALVTQAGFSVERHVVVQRGFPSEVLVGE